MWHHVIWNTFTCGSDEPTASTFREEEEMKAADSSKMLATFYLMTWYHVPEDIILVTAIKNTNLSHFVKKWGSYGNEYQDHNCLRCDAEWSDWYKYFRGTCCSYLQGRRKQMHQVTLKCWYVTNHTSHFHIQADCNNDVFFVVL